MTNPQDPATPASDRAVLALEPGDLSGHTIDELSDYLDAGRLPANPSIDQSASCQLALDALARLREVARTLLDVDVRNAPAADDNWVHRILDNIGLEARAGRDIPLRHPAPSAELVLTEGAVRGIIRTAGDSIDGILIGRCRFSGDVSVPGEPISVSVEASAVWGKPIMAAADRVRQAIHRELQTHTELNVTDIDVTVHDIHMADDAEADDQAGVR